MPELDAADMPARLGIDIPAAARALIEHFADDREAPIALRRANATASASASVRCACAGSRRPSIERPGGTARIHEESGAHDARDLAHGGFTMPVIPQEPSEPLSRSEVVYNGSERQSITDQQHATHAERVTDTAITSGASLEVIGSAGAAVLAIIGLAGYLPTYMTAIATIVIGGALLAHGASVTARWSHAMRQFAPSTTDRAELAGGLGSELLGGACGVVLGILALANVAPETLLAVAAIVFGGSILLSAPAQPDLARLAPDRDPRFNRFTYGAVEGSAGAMMLAGLGAIVLGILGLIRIGPPLTLVLVSMLGVGCALLLSGSALTARFARRLHQAW